MDRTFFTVYGYTLAWLMRGDSPKTDLIDNFPTMNLSFEEFKAIAKENKWWVTSMEDLSDLENLSKTLDKKF